VPVIIKLLYSLKKTLYGGLLSGLFYKKKIVREEARCVVGKSITPNSITPNPIP
jgi:hypothetical protein